VIVALVEYPAQMAAPLAGVATFKAGATMAEAMFQVQMVPQAVALQP
jgi:hypothetical protein